MTINDLMNNLLHWVPPTQIICVGGNKCNLQMGFQAPVSLNISLFPPINISGNFQLTCLQHIICHIAYSFVVGESHKFQITTKGYSEIFFLKFLLAIYYLPLYQNKIR